MLTAHSLRGIFVPVVTPFDLLGNLDWISYEKLLNRTIGNDINGLILSGVTGEASTIADHELELLIRKTHDAAQGKPIIVGTGFVKPSIIFKRLKFLKKLGVDGAMVPITSLIPFHKEDLIRELADVDLSILLHDLPSPSTGPVMIEFLLSVMDINEVIGVKTSTGDIRRLYKLAHSSKKPVLCGEDSLFFASLSCGAKGGILASANLDSKPFLTIYELFRAGKISDAGRLFDQMVPLIHFLFTEPSPALLKWLLAQHGCIRSEKLRSKT